MLQIPLIAFVALLQSSILFGVLSVVLFALWRRTRRSLHSHDRTTDTSAATQRPDIHQYLRQEEKLTRGRNEALGYGEQKEQNALDEEERLLLLFRSDMLNLEQTWADNEIRDDTYWHQVIQDLRKLMKRHDLHARFAMAKDDEIKELRGVLDEQAKSFEELSGNLQNANENDMEELKQKLHKLAQSHKELAGCVYILEDENHFLREQVAVLLQG